MLSVAKHRLIFRKKQIDELLNPERSEGLFDFREEAASSVAKHRWIFRKIFD